MVCFVERPIRRAKYDAVLGDLAGLLKSGKITPEHYDHVLGKLIGVELDERDEFAETIYERRMRGG